jgi:hypothetical protein
LIHVVNAVSVVVVVSVVVLMEYVIREMMDGRMEVTTMMVCLMEVAMAMVDGQAEVATVGEATVGEATAGEATVEATAEALGQVAVTNIEEEIDIIITVMKEKEKDIREELVIEHMVMVDGVRREAINIYRNSGEETKIISIKIMHIKNSNIMKVRDVVKGWNILRNFSIKLKIFITILKNHHLIWI